MSSALAIAGVTQILRDILNDALIDQDVSGVLGGHVNVRALPPDVIEDEIDASDSLINIFLHRVSLNTGWSNSAMPSRDSRGDRLNNPPLALDLSYLISAYGGEDLHAEILLGHAMQILHEHPVFGRAEIEAALNTLPAIGGDLPASLQSLGTTGLAEQIEQIRITPVFLSVDELSKLWTSCQASLRSSMTYLVTVILIQARAPGRNGLPVLTIGDGNRGPTTEPTLLPPYPAITGITRPANQPSARLGTSITILGHHLDGNPVIARFSNARLPDPILVNVPPANVTAHSAAVAIPNAPAAWLAGPFTVELDVQRAGEPTPRRSNAFGLLIAPRLTLPPSSITRQPNDDVNVDVQVAPQVRPGQVVSLVIGNREAIAEPVIAQTATLSFVFTDLPAGNRPARLRVDGVDSWLIDRAARPPVMDPAQFITVPP